MNDCRVIAIANQKGGVGKTTTTVALGAAIAELGHRVLLIDADPQGSLSISLGLRNPDSLEYTLSDVINATIEDETIPYYQGIIDLPEDVDLMPSNIELSGMENKLLNVMNREKILKTYVDQERKYYDFILIDSMPSLGMLTVNALAAADEVIIPTQPNLLSSKGLNLLLQSVGKVKRFLNPELLIGGILLTMADSRTNNARAVESALREGIGKSIRIYDSVIPFSVRAAECPNEGVSILTYDPNGKVAEAYRNLATEVIEDEQVENKDRPRDHSAR